MMFRILPLLLLPMICFSQVNSPLRDSQTNSGNTTSEKQAFEIKRNAFYNLEEIKVRWKKAALENCPGVPCPTFSAPGSCSSIVATPSGPSSASVSFVPPTSDGGSPITGYTVTATSTPSAPAKRKTTAAIITVSGTSSPIVVTGLSLGINYIFAVVATNAVGPSPTITTTTTVTPCVLNTASAGSSSPTLAVNTALTNITHSTTIATGIGTASGLPSGVTAFWSANVITISGTPTVTGSFSYEIPLTGGCGSVKATGSITVGATPACASAAASTTPTLTVNTVLTNITHATTSATGIGTASGLPTGVTAAWSSSSNTITISGTPTNTGTFNYTIPLTGTSCSAVNATGTITVSAPVCPATIAYNSYNYNTGSIGTQCWMQENLRTRLYNDGTEISFNNSGGSVGNGLGQTWSSLTYGAHTLYAYDSVTTPSSNLTTYGYLYNWYAAKGIATAGSTTYKNICPTGWHVPTDSDWNKLIRSIDSGADTTGTTTQSTTAGGKMKSTGDNTAGTGLWNSPNTGADNASGFTVLPGGARNSVGSFSSIRGNAFFWSAAEGGGGNAWYRYLYASNGNVSRSNNLKSVGASVRCLRD